MFAEQAAESLHYDFDRFWSRMSRKNSDNPLFLPQMLRAVQQYNMLHVVKQQTEDDNDDNDDNDDDKDEDNDHDSASDDSDDDDDAVDDDSADNDDDGGGYADDSIPGDDEVFESRSHEDILSKQSSASNDMFYHHLCC